MSESHPLSGHRRVRLRDSSGTSGFFLDKKNQLIADEVMNRGAVDHAPVYPREVTRRALELAASAVILVHNHPSGDPRLSRADIDMTQVEAGRDGVASFKGLGLF